MTILSWAVHCVKNYFHFNYLQMCIIIRTLNLEEGPEIHLGMLLALNQLQMRSEQDSSLNLSQSQLFSGMVHYVIRSRE